MSSNQTFDNSKVNTATVTDNTQKRNDSSSPESTDQPNAQTFAPSQMREHLGAPDIAHDYPEDSTHRRHSSVTAQQAHFMK